jgi:hypothetical protein
MPDISVSQIEHIVIRRPSYVAGTRERPEVQIFVETNTKRRPLSDDLLAKGQVVWMKWKNGPVVAKSRIESWVSGRFDRYSIDAMRQLTRGTKLYDLGEYWDSVRQKDEGYFTVVRLTSEEWLDAPFDPEAKSSGSAWIYLDSQEKKNRWIVSGQLSARGEGTFEERISSRSERLRKPLSPRLRFDVLRRDNFTCRYCGRRAPDVVIEVDHVEPYSVVREHLIENLVAACIDCNRGKGARGLARRGQ